MARANGFLKFTETFPNEQSCLKYLEELRWKGKVVSPFDEISKVYKCRNGKYKCSKTGKYFDAKTGTMFAKTKLPLRYWFYAMFLFLLRGISSCRLACDLDITQATAWNMLYKIREYMDYLKIKGESPSLPDRAEFAFLITQQRLNHVIKHLGI